MKQLHQSSLKLKCVSDLSLTMTMILFPFLIVGLVGATSAEPNCGAELPQSAAAT